MVSKNNHAIQMQEVAERQPHFGIRKLTIGVASVLLSTTLWLSGTTSSVHAETTDSGNGEDKATDESNTQTQSIDNNTQVVVQTDGSNSSADQKVETNNNENTSSEGLETNADSSAVQSTTKETPESGSTSQSTDRSAQSVSQSSTQNAGQTNQGTSSVNNTNSNTNITQNNSTETSINNKVDSKTDLNSDKNTNSASNEKNTTTTNSQNNSAETTIENKSDGLDQNATDLSKTGLTGITAKNVPDTSNLLENNVVTTNNSKEDNEVNVNHFSSLRAAQLFASSYIKDQTTGNNDVINFDDITANTTITSKPTLDQLRGVNVEEGQTVYNQFFVKDLNKMVTLATDTANPGKNFYVYVTNMKVLGSGLNYTPTDKYAVKTYVSDAYQGDPNHPETLHLYGTQVPTYYAPVSSSTQMYTLNDINLTGGTTKNFTTSTTVNGKFQGGTYTFTHKYNQVPLKGVGAGLTANTYSVKATDSNQKILDGDEVSLRWGSRKQVYNLYSINNAKNTSRSLDEIAKDGASLWSDISAWVPAKITQKIYYVDADTGKVLGTKDDLIDGLSGQTYTTSGEIDPNKVKFDDGKTYSLVSSDQATDAAKSATVDTINNVDISASDLNDGYSQMQTNGHLNGVLSMYNKGDELATGISNASQDPVIYFKVMLDNHGTAEYNTYKLLNGTTFMDKLSGARVARGQVLSQDGNREINGSLDGNSGYVFYYKVADDQKATIKYVDDDNNYAEIPGYDQETVTGAEGDQINFGDAQSNVEKITKSGYTYIGTTTTDKASGFVNDAKNFDNVKFPNYDNIEDNSQDYVVHFKHKIDTITPNNPNGKIAKDDLTKTVTRTIQYIYGDTGAKAADSVDQKLTFNGTAYYDEAKKQFVNSATDLTPVADQNNPVQRWDIENGSGDSGTFEAVTSPTTADGIKTGYKATAVSPATLNDGNFNVKSQNVNHNSASTNVTVVYTKAPTSTYHAGTDETKVIHRTINYYDETTGQKIPSDLISTNPYSDSITFTRTPILDENNKVVGYGTVSADGKTFQNLDWHTANGSTNGNFEIKSSKDLGSYNYTAPVFKNTLGFQDGSDASSVPSHEVTSGSSDLVYNVYYGHKTQSETTTKEVKRNFDYVFTDGTKASDHSDLNPQGTQTVTFTGTATKDLVTGKTSDVVWTPETGTLAQVGAHQVNGYKIVSAINGTIDGGADSLSVTPNSSDTTVTIVYSPNTKTPDTQKATLEIIDNNDATKPETLASFTNQGDSKDQITFANSNETLQGYLNRGYEVQKTEGNLSGNASTGYTYPTYGTTAQDFKIYLVHGTENVPATATSTAQVHYVVADGGAKAPADSPIQTITWHTTNKVDKVTGQVITPGTWTDDNKSFDDVTSPDLSKDGYTPSVEKVHFDAPERNVNQRITVVYNRSAQAADLQIIDDNDPANQRTLAVYTDNGASGKQISFTGSNEQLQNYLTHGYVFEKTDGQGMSGDQTKGFTYPVFDNDGNTEQSFKIYLKHGTKDVEVNATAHAHVHYIIADGGTKAPDDSPTQTITWTTKNTVDAVDGHTITEGTSWNITSPNKTFTDVKSPDVDGYTPGTDNVQFKTPERNQDQVVDVVYTKKSVTPTPDTQKAIVIYQDVNDPNKTVTLGQSDQLTGQAGDTIKYSTKDQINHYEDEGYVLVNNGFDPDGETPSFDNVKDNTQKFYVTFKHGTVHVTPDNPGKPGDKINPNDPRPQDEQPKYPEGTTKTDLTKQITRTIHYEGADQYTPGDVDQTVDFSAKGVLDKVTGEWITPLTWSKDQTVKGVNSPKIPGYKVVSVDKDTTDNQNVTDKTLSHTNDSYTVTVKYAKDQAPTADTTTGKVTYIDDTENKPLRTDSLSGKVGDNINYTTQDKIDNYENMGYKLASKNFTDGEEIFNKDASKNSFEVHLVHDLIPVTPDNPGKPGDKINPNDPRPTDEQPKYPKGTAETDLTKSITRTIHYEGADQYTPNDVEQSVNFTAKGVLDRVTGEWTTPLTWSSDQTVKGVNSPKIPGYKVVSVDKDTTDNQNVTDKTLSHTDSDYTVTVKYAKDQAPTPTKQGTIEITYHDNTDNVDLPGYGEPQTKEDEGTSFSYNPNAKDIPALENKGYVLDGNLPTIPTKYTDGDQHVIIYMKHGTRPVDPDHPANPKDPVDPTHPGTPTPSDPNLSKTDLEKDVTRTVKYQYEDGTQAHSDSVQTVNFKGQGVIDLVTGNLVDVDKDGKILDQRGKITWDHDSQNLDPVKAIDHDGYYVSGVSETGTNAKVTDTAVAGETVTPTSQNSTIIITLTKNPDKPTKQNETANLHIIDITDGNKNLGNFTASGEDNTAINFNGGQTTVDSLVKAGYEVEGIVQATTNPDKPIRYENDYAKASSQWKFDNLPGTPQDFYVYLVHGYTPINPNNSFGRTDLTKTVKETVHYVDEDTQKPLTTDYTNTLTFNGQGRVDKVTGKMLKVKSVENGQITYDYNVNDEIDIKDAKASDFVWSAPTTLNKVTSPDLTKYGYTVDASKTTPAEYADGNDIKEFTNVGYDHGDIEATVYYKAAPQEVHNADLSIYANDKLAGTANVSGAKDTPINFGDASKIVSDLINQGYVFDHAQDITNNKEMPGKSYGDLNFGNFSEQNNSDQKFAIYLTKKVAPEKTEQNAQLTIKDVTPGQEQDLGNYTQPGLEGDAISFSDAQQFVQSLLDKGYVWDGASYNGTNLDAKGYSDIKFGNYDNTDDKNGISQKWVINLVHGYTPVNPDHPDDKDGFTKEYLDRTITRTVNYVDENGNEMPGLKPEKQTAHYEGSGYLDNVTHRWVNVVGNKITGLSTGLIWTPNEDTKFDAIGPKSATGYKVISVSGTGISGFTIGKDGSVTEQNVNKNTPSSVITVVYGPQDKTPATGSITYTDDTTGAVLEKAGFNGAVGDKIDYTTADRIAYYENKGYDLVSNDFKDGEETFAKEGNIFNVHLVHATTPITPDKPGKPGEEVPNPKDPQHPHKIPDNFQPQDLKKTVTRDVTYVYEDGTQADTPVHQTFTFEGQGVIDLVTGQLVKVENGKITGAGKITWNAESHDFDATKSIDTKNYQIVGVKETNTNANVDWNNGVVAKETITPANQNSSIVITLAKKQPDTPVVNKGTVVINYIDKTTGSTLETANATGSEGTEVNYSTKDTIDKYINQGYKLEHDGYPTTTVTFTKGTQTYEVDLVHDTVPVNPDKPGKPGEPINPNDPNGPKYPDDTDAKNLTKTITRTINYVGDGLNIPSSHSEVQFVASGVLDKVTGQWTTPLTWTVKGGNADSSEFAQVTGPKVDGYKITNISSTNEDISDVDKDTGTVAGKTINHTNGNIVITINYTKSQTPAQAENADLHIIDITDNNKELGKFNDSGADNSAINFNGAQTTIDALIKGGYKVNSIVQATNDPNNPTKYGTDYATASSQWKFDDKPGTDQAFYVYVEHDYAPINPENAYGRTDLTKTVTETVHYLDEDTNKQVATDYTNKVTFTGQGRVDKVTGKMLKIKSIDDKGITYDYNVDDEIDIKDAKLSDFAWSTPTTLNKVESPTIDGYKVDSSKTTPADLADGDGIKAIQNVGYDHANIEATVYYKKSETPTPDTVTGKITYYDDTTGSTLDSDSFTGHVGDKITYTTQDKIDSYEDKGYNLVSNNFKDGDETFAKDGNTFEVHLVHATTTITPDKPGKPGDEVPNPSDPKHPHKIPDSFVPQTLTHTVTRDVSYVYDDGTKAPDPVHQSFTFTGQGVVDLVTGQLVNVDKDGKITGAGKITWNADSHDFEATKEIKHDGYNIVGVDETNTNAKVDRTTGVVAGQTVTPTSQNSTVVITLSKKPAPTEEQGSIKVTIHDVRTGQDVPGYGKDSGTQKAGTDFSFDKTTTIQDLEKHGYKVLNPDIEIPTKIGDTDQNFVINVDHNIIPVTPDKPGNGLTKDDLEKTVTETIHYVVNGGDATAPADKTVDLKFNGTGYYDAVTGKWTDAQGNELKDQTKNITWTAENGDKFAEVDTPVIKGYTPTVSDGYGDSNNNVKEIDNITPATKDITVTVTYNPTEPTQPTKKQGSITVIVHDDTNNTDIYNYSTGKVDEGTQVPFNHANMDKYLTDHGYEIVKDPEIPSTVGDSDQTYVIHVTKKQNPEPTPQPTQSPEPQPTQAPSSTPSKPTPTPQPSAPTQPTQPSEQPSEPNEPDEPDEPDVPETPKKPHEHKRHETPSKPSHRTPAPTPTRNTAPRPQNNYWSNNVSPHGQGIGGGYNNNVAPHGQTVNGWNGNVGPNGEHVDSNGNIVAPNGQIIGYVDKNGNPHYTTLPQTGEDKTDETAAVLGGLAASLGLLGLAGVRKRREDK